MSAQDDALIVPGHGTVFFAPASAKFPDDPLTAFALDKEAPAGWTDLGHTSKENTISFSKDGGDKSQLDSFYRDAVRVVYGATSWGATVNTLQMTKDSLDLAFDGEVDDTVGRYIIPAATGSVAGQMVILLQDTTDSMLVWMPNVQTSLGDAPEINTEGFFEVQLAVSVLSSSKLTAKGKTGLMAWYKNSFKKAKGGQA